MSGMSEEELRQLAQQREDRKREREAEKAIKHHLQQVFPIRMRSDGEYRLRVGIMKAVRLAKEQVEAGAEDVPPVVYNVRMVDAYTFRVTDRAVFEKYDKNSEEVEVRVPWTARTHKGSARTIARLMIEDIMDRSLALTWEDFEALLDQLPTDPLAAPKLVEMAGTGVHYLSKQTGEGPKEGDVHAKLGELFYEHDSKCHVGNIAVDTPVPVLDFSITGGQRNLREDLADNAGQAEEVLSLKVEEHAPSQMELVGSGECGPEREVDGPFLDVGLATLAAAGVDPKDIDVVATEGLCLVTVRGGMASFEALADEQCETFSADAGYDIQMLAEKRVLEDSGAELCIPLAILRMHGRVVTRPRNQQLLRLAVRLMRVVDIEHHWSTRFDAPADDANTTCVVFVKGFQTTRVLRHYCHHCKNFRHGLYLCTQCKALKPKSVNAFYAGECEFILATKGLRHGTDAKASKKFCFERQVHREWGVEKETFLPFHEHICRDGRMRCVRHLPPCLLKPKGDDSEQVALQLIKCSSCAKLADCKPVSIGNRASACCSACISAGKTAGMSLVL